MNGVTKKIRTCIECKQTRKTSCDRDTYRCLACIHRHSERTPKECRDCQATAPTGKQFCDDCRRKRDQARNVTAIGLPPQKKALPSCGNRYIQSSNGLTILANQALSPREIEAIREHRIKVYTDQFQRDGCLNYRDPRLVEVPENKMRVGFMEEDVEPLESVA